MQQTTKDLDSLLTYFKTRLFPYAYNIIGDSMAAEDVVHEVLNHYFIETPSHIRQPEGYLIRAVINNAINHKNLLRNKLESYPGHWLPTPVLTEDVIYKNADQEEILNYSLLVLLEKLNAKERAVFILKETYEYSHEDIASILEMKAEHSRQLLKRAKVKLDRKIDAGPLDHDSDQKKMLEQLTEAILNNNLDKVKSVLSKDVKTISDGGEKVSAARKILVGPDRTTKLLEAIYGKYMPASTQMVFTTINHLPAITFATNGVVFRCVMFEIQNGKIEHIYIVVNPDKLEKLNIH
ncbi:MAG: sigma-70 family RNA polymerase sigma factor [Cyclobacteriaceae bacterium]